ncbi:hypothetical protein O181_004508 [Austropuccinia psidii MF-1]|uniref:Uncharacterized protein n=1 Tax=Austropuccinia psidii MF-1 TaxID=1389203 RepID=A0A9Q3BGH3_9BASI|nr:hypothetical protein [Austropuccinia psidii MF-1]
MTPTRSGVKYSIELDGIVPSIQSTHPRLAHMEYSKRPEPSSGRISLNIPNQVQKLLHRHQTGGIREAPKPVDGDHELLPVNQGVLGSREDHKSGIRLIPN